MKKLIFLFLLIPALLFGQEYTSGPLVKTYARDANNNYIHDITGDTTLTLNIMFGKSTTGEIKSSGFFELYILADSLNGNGTFASSDTSDIELKHRLEARYSVTTDAQTNTFYVTNNDSIAINNVALAVGSQNFDISTGADETDGWQMTHDFNAGDTLRVIYILEYSGRP